MQTYTPISRFRPTLLAIIANCAGLAAALPAAAQVAGDECSNAIVVTANTPVSVDTAPMTASASPPSSIIGPCGFMNWGATTKDAWFRFDAPADGRLTALLCGSNYDTSVVMYQGSCGSLFRIACDDDDCQPSGPTYQSKIMDQVVTAGPVYIRVGGYSTAAGTAVLDVQYEETVGAVRCWGDNGYGQCNTPADLGPCSSVAGGFFHTIALRSDGGVRCWGDNPYGQCNTPADLGPCSSVAGGGAHTIALRIDGVVRCWGRNIYGQCNTPVDLGACSSVAGGGLHTIALNRPDCDSNGVNDYTELAGHDCNANGIHDCTDSLAGNIEDCNNNGLGDSCEKQLQVLASSGQVGPIGALTPRVFTVSSAVEALEPDAVTIRIRARGDFSGGLEYIRVRIGSTLDRNALGGTVDCGAGTPWQEFTMSATAFNQSFEPDGSLRVRLDPSTAVDSNLCPEGTWVEVQLSYLGARSTDCNLNGVMDTCEIADGLTVDINHNGVPDTCETPFTACPGDFDGNNTVSGSDLGALLGSWGPCPPGAVGDMDSNGVVNGADLGALLGAWGPCDS